MMLGERARMGAMAFSDLSGFGQGGGRRQGPGMGGPGEGKGGSIGELPDMDAGLTPTTLPGEMTRGKLLTSVMERTSPEADAESTIAAANKMVLEAEQEAEQALAKEEIPPGSREWVRQYFGSFEPESNVDGGSSSGSGIARTGF
jgi:hypothetical protein